MQSVKLALIGVLAATTVAVAGPGHRQKAPDRNDNDVSITMVAGKGRLGIAVLQISPELRRHFGAPDDRGVLIDNVRPDSVAARAGLKVGDVVLAIDGKPVGEAADLLSALQTRKKGDTVAIAVERAGQPVAVSAKLEDDPGPAMPRLRSFNGSNDDDFFRNFGDDKGIQRMMDEMRKRFDELEQRMQRLEQPQHPRKT